MSSQYVHAAVEAAWNANNLDSGFVAASGVSPCLHETEAKPGQPFPYCVFTAPSGTIQTRMTGHNKNEHHQIIDYPWTFEVFAKQANGLSAKALAVQLKDSLKQVYGGHPTVPDYTFPLGVGNHLLTQFQTEYGRKAEEDIYIWTLEYIFRIDEPYRIL